MLPKVRYFESCETEVWMSLDGGSYVPLSDQPVVVCESPLFLLGRSEFTD